MKEAPYLEYNFNIVKPGKYEIEIRCIPTHSNNYDQEVSVEVNGKGRESYSINTKGRSDAWKENVLRNYSRITHSVTFGKTGIQTLKLEVNQTGIVFDQISIAPENHPRFYEIGNQ